MIDKQIPSLALAFKNYANERTEQSPILQLDDTWPCACTLDLFCRHLRGKQELTEADNQFIDGVAAYLSGICFAAWSHFPDKLEISIALASDEEGPGVTISAQDGRFLQPNEKVIINISRALKFILRDPPNPFPVYYKFAKNMLADENILALFALGLFSGQSPFSKGPWKELEPTRFEPYLKGLEEFLSKSSAAYYARVFPDEPLGQIPELYLHNLILPSYTHVENFPAYLGTTTLMQKLAKSNEKPKYQKEVAINLAQSPCPFISAASFAASVGLLNERLPDNLLAVATAKRDYIHTLRPAVMLARKMAGKDHDWLRLVEEDRIEAAQKLLDEDLALGLSPLLKFNQVSSDMKEFKELFMVAAWSNIDACTEWFEKNSEKELPYSVLVLKAFVSICKDDYESCKLILEKLESLNDKNDKAQCEKLALLKADYLTFSGKTF